MQLEMIKVLFVLSAVIFVIFAELFNTAIEIVVNMITREYNPLAKIAKDVAAAGVLVAAFYAVFVGCGVFITDNKFADLINGATNISLKVAPPNPIVVLIVAFGVLSLSVVIGKAKRSHGSILKGGAISAHTAIAFMLFVGIAIYSSSDNGNIKFNMPVIVMALILAILVAQSRVEGRIHTLREVLWGAAVAFMLMALLLLFPTHIGG
jgi:diacylglycerol kinase (ATP)